MSERVREGGREGEHRETCIDKLVQKHCYDNVEQHHTNDKPTKKNEIHKNAAIFCIKSRVWDGSMTHRTNVCKIAQKLEHFALLFFLHVCREEKACILVNLAVWVSFCIDSDLPADARIPRISCRNLQHAVEEEEDSE